MINPIQPAFCPAAVWNYVYMIWKQAGEPIPSTALTLIIEVVGVIGTAFALRFTSITWEDFGLGVKGLKKALFFDSILTVLVLAALVLAKFLGRLFFPGVINPDKPFALWSMFSVLDLLYLPTVVIQEFLTRGVVQGSLDRILPDYYPAAVSIVVSSMFFGALHLHKGLLYMLGAAFLLSFFGILYRRQRSIWGLCIPHLVLSWSFNILCFKLVTLLYISTRHLPGYYLASFHVDFDVPESWKLLYLAAGTLLPLLLAALWRRVKDRVSV